MDEFVYLVVREGALHRETASERLPLRKLQELVGGSIEGVPLPDAVEGLEVIGYCNANGVAEGLGANCYVHNLRYPIPGPLLVTGMSESGGSRSLTDDEVELFSLRVMNGRPLPTLWIAGFVPPNSAEDPAVDDQYEVGEPMEPPPMFFIGFD